MGDSRVFFLVWMASLTVAVAYETSADVVVRKIEIAGFYIENQGRLLLLQNAVGDTEPGKWGVPAGKLKRGESPMNGAIRELFEETGIMIADFTKIVSLGAFFGRKPGIDYVFHQFVLKIDVDEVRLSEEHQNYCWATPEEVGRMPLMDGGREAYARYRTMMGD